MKDNFDIHEWNKNRYLKEGINDRVLKANLSDLSYDILTNYFNDERFNAPNPDDSSTSIISDSSWENWKERTMDRFGDVEVELDNTKVWYDQFKILDSKFIKDRDESINAKASALANWRKDPNYYPGD
jgi:hypothetical protein|tara:strand:- start:552 stop:935 length:384 start_codon:yes stop_codon:yes gene_type:complete